MLSFCLKCRTNVEESNERRVTKTKNKTIMLSSVCAVCNSKKSKFIKERENNGLLNQLGIKFP